MSTTVSRLYYQIVNNWRCYCTMHEWTSFFIWRLQWKLLLFIHTKKLVNWCCEKAWLLLLWEQRACFVFSRNKSTSKIDPLFTKGTGSCFVKDVVYPSLFSDHCFPVFEIKVSKLCEGKDYISDKVLKPSNAAIVKRAFKKDKTCIALAQKVSVIA